MARKKTWSAALIVVLAAVIFAAAGALIWHNRLRDPFAVLEAGARDEWAIERLRQMALKNPEDLRVQEWLLRVEFERGELDKAESRVSMLTIKAPDHYITLSGSCRLYMKQGNWQKAAGPCLEALEKSDRSLSDLLFAGSALLKTGDLDVAYPILNEAKEKAPDDPMVLNNLGYLYLLKNEYESAIEHLRKALEKDPSRITARKNLARAFVESARYRQAITELETILSAHPDDLDSLFNLSMIYAMYFKDKDSAKQYLDQAVAKGLDKQRSVQLMNLIVDLKPSRYDDRAMNRADLEH